MLFPTPREMDRGHWASTMVDELAAAIDALSDDAFELLAVVHQPTVCTVMAAYRPGRIPAITSSIVGREAWHDVFDLATALGIDIPD